MLPIGLLIIYFFPFLNSTCSDYRLEMSPSLIFNTCCGQYTTPDGLPTAIPVLCFRDFCPDFTKYLFTDCNRSMITLIFLVSILMIGIMCSCFELMSSTRPKRLKIG